MIDIEAHARIRRLFYAEHWKIGTIAQELGLHPDTVRRSVGSDQFNDGKALRPSVMDPYVEFIGQVLDKHPRLRATRIYQMIRDRGYTGSIVQLRRFVAGIRPSRKEAFLLLRTFPGEQGQVDWASFGTVRVGRAQRRLSCFVITLSYSRALYLEFFFDQKMESFLRGHVNAFSDWQGLPRMLLYDNLRSAVLERRGDNIRFNPRLLELCSHYHFAPRPCQVAAGNQRGVSNAQSDIYGNHSLPPGRLPPWRTSTGRHSNGVIGKRIPASGPAAIIVRSWRRSRKKSPGCYPCRFMHSIPRWSFPCSQKRSGLPVNLWVQKYN